MGCLHMWATAGIRGRNPSFRPLKKLGKPRLYVRGSLAHFLFSQCYAQLVLMISSMKSTQGAEADGLRCSSSFRPDARFITAGKGEIEARLVDSENFSLECQCGRGLCDKARIKNGGGPVPRSRRFRVLAGMSAKSRRLWRPD